jgi:uncharacterized protein Usg
MKSSPAVVAVFAAFILFSFTLCSSSLSAQTNLSDTAGKKHLYIDVHHLGAGKVTYKDVVAAHAKDLAVEHKYGIEFLKFWVDEKNGDVYCLSSASDSSAIRKTHGEAHGLLPDEIFMVTDGQAATLKGNDNLFLDIHELGPGNVTAKDVAGAHAKDLAVEGKYGVNFIDYWVDEKKGMVMCLSQAKDSAAIAQTHKEAHGLMPVSVAQVKEGE